MNRRSMLRLGGGMVAPVLMTLASRSAFSCYSTTPSAFGSINASRPDALKPLSGRSPEYWDNGENWPLPYISKKTRHKSATTFNSVFGGIGSPCESSNTTLLEVLKESYGSDRMQVARACVAALLNAQSGKTATVLPVSSVIEIWMEFSSKGYYEPTAGIRWYANHPQLPDNGIANTGGKGGILGYLNTTWT